GNMDRLASICGVPLSAISDWVNGTTNIPYHSLQRLAQELGIEQPQVSELRREFQSASAMPQTRRAEPEPPPSRAEARRELKKVQDVDRPRRQERQRKAPKAQQAPRQERQERQKKQERKPQRQQQRQPQAAKGPSAPKLSDKLAYWTGALFAAARAEEGRIVFTADKRIGQNYAGTWSGIADELFGVRPTLYMAEERKVQRAELLTAGLEDFFARLEFKPGASPEQAPGAPRWAWSNPDWKTAFLRGVVDASARFSRAPSLQISSLSPRLRQSLQKILSSLKFTVQEGPEGALILEGAEAVEKYFDTVGTGNMKLKDQFKAYRSGAQEPAEDASDAAPSAEPVAQTELETPIEADAGVPEAGPEEPPPAAEGSAPAEKSADAPAKPARPAARRKPKRTAYRGKPGSR
ncbi:MAG TPA: hypothetical protein VNI01_04225, partial [Elusimicrobiota bacterium]|nr:hypothetical protein [Elusimicrobiota bacterium]